MIGFIALSRMDAEVKVSPGIGTCELTFFTLIELDQILSFRAKESD